MPTNLYGPGDNYHQENSHVLPALIRRFHDATEKNLASVTCWGSGNALREFLYVDDLGDACVFALENWQNSPSQPPTINVGTGKDLSIRQLAEMIADIIGFKGVIHWDTTKPSGTPKKQLDVTRLANLGWLPKIGLEEGLARTYDAFLHEVKTQHYALDETLRQIKANDFKLMGVCQQNDLNMLLNVLILSFRP